MRKIFNLVFLFFIFCSNLFGQEQKSQATKSPDSPSIKFVSNDTLYDFGGIPLGTAIPYQFEIKNTGNTPLIISGMTCESRYVQCQWPGKAIKPGKRGYLTVTYTAHNDEGSFKTVVYIASNATTAPYPFIHIIGAVIPANEPYSPSQPSKSKGRRGK